MKKLLIKKIEHYNFLLQDEKNCIYNMNIEFYDVNIEIKVNDILYMNEELLKEKTLSIGLIDSSYGRKIKNYLDQDIIVLQTKQKRFYLKRIYG